MKLIILKTNLKEGLDAVGRITTDGSYSLPILKNFLLETVDNKIKLNATNLELAVTKFISGKIVEGGGLTIPLGIFNSIIGNLQAERINLETEGDNLIIKTDNYEAKIQGIKREEFPIIPRVDKGDINFEVGVGVLRDSLSFVISAAQISDLSPELNGVLFSFENNSLKFAATDRFRLAEKTIGENQFRAGSSTFFRAIVPLKTVNEIIRVFKDDAGKIKIFFDNNQIFCQDDNLEVISRLINGEFPDYGPIIPKSIETEISLNRAELINALKLTSSFTDRLSEIRIIVADGAKNIEIFSFGQGLGENRYLIPAKIKGTGVEAVFNWRFMLDGVKNLAAETIVWGLNGDSRAAIVKSPTDNSLFYILMPIKAS